MAEAPVEATAGIYPNYEDDKGKPIHIIHANDF